MPTLEETWEERHWPGLGELLSGIKKGVDEYVPNPMRPLENPYSPGEHIGRALEIVGTPFNALAGAGAGAFEAVTSPQSRKELEKSVLAASPAMTGSAGGRMPSRAEAKAGMNLATEGKPGGYVTLGPKVARAGKDALELLKKSDPEYYDFITRSNQEYAFRSGTKDEARKLYNTQDVESIGGWNEERPQGSTSVLIDEVVDAHGGQGNRWQLGANVHEAEHGVMRELQRLNPKWKKVNGNFEIQDVGTGIPGTAQSESFKNYLLSLGTQANPQYLKAHMPRELAANTIEARALGDMNSERGRVFDQKAFDRFKREVIVPNTKWGNEPLVMVDPSIEGLPGKPQYVEDFLRDQDKKAKYAKMDEEKARQKAEWKATRQPRLRRGDVPPSMSPHADLQELLDQFGEPSEKVGTDLSLGGTLGEAQRPWNIPEAEQAGIYDAMNPGKKKYGGSYDPVQGRKQIYDLTPPTSAGEMPSEVADYIMKKFTAMHEDVPVVKEQKRRGLANAMEWWQSASDDDRRMYVKMIQQTGEKSPPPQPKSEPRYQQMAPVGQNKKKARNEQMRLMNVQGLRKK